MSAPRVRPGRLGEVGVLAWVLSRAGGRLAGTTPMTLFLTLGRHKRLFRGWLAFAALLMPGGRLPRAESELVILRVAHLRGSGYERAQHERLGRRAGLSAADVDRTTHGPDAAGWTPRRAALLAVVDQLVLDRDVDDATWDRLRGHLDERECVELVLLTGHYDMLAAAISTLRIQRESPRRIQREPPRDRA